MEQREVRLADIAPRLALARDQWLEERRARIERMGISFARFNKAMEAYAAAVAKTGLTMAEALAKLTPPGQKPDRSGLEVVAEATPTEPKH
jgi:hypothetical protein